MKEMLILIVGSYVFKKMKAVVDENVLILLTLKLLKELDGPRLPIELQGGKFCIALHSFTHLLYKRRAEAELSLSLYTPHVKVPSHNT